MSYYDLSIFIPSLIAIAFIVAFYPFLLYIIGRLMLKFNSVRGLRLWAMSGFNLKSIPKYCSFVCSESKCGNWTCPCYNKSRKRDF